MANLASQDVSQPTLEHLDAEVRRILDEQEEAAHSILADHRGVLDALVAALVRDETIRGPELASLLGGVRPYSRGRSAKATGANGGSSAARATPAPARGRRPRGE